MSAKKIADQVRDASSLAEVERISRGLTDAQAAAVVRELESRIADATQRGAAQ